MSTNLSALYEIDKSNLISKNLTLVIGTRKHPTPNKPKNYLLQKTGQSFRYISSIYLQPPTGQEMPQIYEFDYSGSKYTLSIKTGIKQAEIKPCKEVVASNP